MSIWTTKRSRREENQKLRKHSFEERDGEEITHSGHLPGWRSVSKIHQKEDQEQGNLAALPSVGEGHLQEFQWWNSRCDLCPVLKNPVEAWKRKQELKVVLSTILRFSLPLGLLQTLNWRKADEIFIVRRCGDKRATQEEKVWSEHVWYERNFTSNSSCRNALKGGSHGEGFWEVVFRTILFAYWLAWKLAARVSAMPN